MFIQIRIGQFFLFAALILQPFLAFSNSLDGQIKDQQIYTEIEAAVVALRESSSGVPERYRKAAASLILEVSEELKSSTNVENFQKNLALAEDLVSLAEELEGSGDSGFESSISLDEDLPIDEEPMQFRYGEGGGGGDPFCIGESGVSGFFKVILFIVSAALCLAGDALSCAALGIDVLNCLF